MNIKTALCIALIATATSCVPQRQFKDMKSQKEKCEDERTKLRAQVDALEVSRNELQTAFDAEKAAKNELETSNAQLSAQNKNLQSENTTLNNSLNALRSIQDEMLSGKDAETRKAMAKFQKAQSDLIQREDSLRKMESALNEKSAKLQELQNMLAQKDAAVKDLKKKVNDALVGFTGNGLTVEQKNGKIYVSLEEQLLFASGSTVIDKKGKEALIKLAKVLEQNKDINVQIEGHTDNVPILGGPIKDNWDLSVMRSTSVVRIMLENSKVDPKRLTTAGKGEFAPVASNATADGKKKNRRIDIILTPKLDELLKVLE